MNGEQWSDEQCGLPTLMMDVLDAPPGDAVQKKKGTYFKKNINNRNKERIYLHNKYLIKGNNQT